MGSSSEGYLGRSINWKPVIAAIHGYALGAGTSIAAECDLIVASEDAQFGITETKRGLPGARVWAKMNAFMPSKVVTEMVITGEPVEAAELYRLGLINRLVPTGKHLEAAEELAEKILKAPPLAARSGVRLTPAAVGPAAKAAPDRGLSGGQPLLRGEARSGVYRRVGVSWRQDNKTGGGLRKYIISAAQRLYDQCL